jgi:hypothetical protein
LVSDNAWRLEGGRGYLEWDTFFIFFSKFATTANMINIFKFNLPQAEFDADLESVEKMQTSSPKKLVSQKVCPQF